MKKVLISYGRAFLLQFNIKMLLLSLLPSVLALGLWAVVLYFSLQPLIDFLQQYFIDNNGFQLAGNILGFLGLLTLKAVIVPLIAMWLLLPLMLLTALLFVACIAMPLINRKVSQQYYPQLEKKHGGGWWSSLGYALVCVVIFVFAWLISLPLTLFMHLGLIIQPVLLGWVTYRVMAHDALAVHASAEERKIILKQHRWQLWTVGIIAGLLGALPGMVWLGGVLSVVFLPLLAAVAIWLYVLVFMFSGLWFQLFCLDALQQLRQA
ncbi:EI24 domain-containing protein [Solimicrobium silvestre]|uniref:Etoposide-induced protein 2.4 (EI24) n=1 Tax=Solimicrobium silvestre TaxID=2099400 RepID=A0A2S9GYY6_9BURK|nr:EI24 domain-containing protein [Solimicrobium silvestre]PRC92949.1 Etoposide-induced protein 2.4 (EI24) [Solimicrobium silvestre]